MSARARLRTRGSPTPWNTQAPPRRGLESCSLPIFGRGVVRVRAREKPEPSPVTVGEIDHLDGLASPSPALNQQVGDWAGRELCERFRPASSDERRTLCSGLRKPMGDGTGALVRAEASHSATLSASCMDAAHPMTSRGDTPPNQRSLHREVGGNA